MRMHTVKQSDVSYGTALHYADDWSYGHNSLCGKPMRAIARDYEIGFKRVCGSCARIMTKRVEAAHAQALRELTFAASDTVQYAGTGADDPSTIGTVRSVNGDQLTVEWADGTVDEMAPGRLVHFTITQPTESSAITHYVVPNALEWRQGFSVNGGRTWHAYDTCDFSADGAVVTITTLEGVKLTGGCSEKVLAQKTHDDINPHIENAHAEALEYAEIIDSDQAMFDWMVKDGATAEAAEAGTRWLRDAARTLPLGADMGPETVRYYELVKKHGDNVPFVLTVPAAH